jgi:hypothetical protein
MICDMIWYAMTYMTYDVKRYMVWYDIWCDMIRYDMIYDVIYDVCCKPPVIWYTNTMASPSRSFDTHKTAAVKNAIFIAIPAQVWTVPQRSRRARLPKCLDSMHMDMVKLLATHTGRLYTHEISLVLISVKRLSRPQGHSAAGRIAVFVRVIWALLFYFGRWKIGVRKIFGLFFCGGLDLGFILV